MLADAAPQVKEGLSFNAVAKGDPRADSNDTQYDIAGAAPDAGLNENQNLTLEYGIARIGRQRFAERRRQRSDRRLQPVLSA